MALTQDKEIMAIVSVPGGGLGVVKKNSRIYICLHGTHSGLNPPSENNPAYTAYSVIYNIRSWVETWRFQRNRNMLSVSEAMPPLSRQR